MVEIYANSLENTIAADFVALDVCIVVRLECSSLEG